jgi:hypothetical protein
MMLRAATLLFAIALALVPAAAANGQTAPSLAVDTFFAPPSGIADGDFSPTNIIPDVPAAVAVAGDRIYTVGRTGSSFSADIGIIARRSDGSFDAGFSGDGMLIVPVAAGTEEDDGRGVTVLTDGRIRVLATTRTSLNKDVLVLGLEPDGDPDPSFGTAADARGNRTVLLTSAGEDTAGRIAAAPDGRIAIVGSRRIGGSDDTFVALLNADGSPVDGFGTNGVEVLNLAGGAVNDRGVDVAFRPGGGVVVLASLESPNRAVLAALDAQGEEDPAFGTGGRLALEVGGSTTFPGGLVDHGGALYVSGSTTIGADTDAFVARVDAAGAAVQPRRFDVRGVFVPAGRAAATHAADLVVVPGAPPTLVAVGTVQYATDGGSQATDWAAAAFNGFETDITAAGYGDLVIPAPGEAGLFSAAAGAGGWAAVAGRHVLNADDGFGTARLLIDADKACDLAVSVAEPAEIVFRGRAPASLPVTVTNVGSRPCAGTVTVPPPYRMTPVETGVVAPGATFAPPAVPIAFDGVRRAEDALVVSVQAAGDANATNDRTLAHVVFSFCDLGLEPVGRRHRVPSEGAWGFPVTLRNSGTIPCRIRIASKPRYSLAGGESVADRVPGRAPRGARPGARARVILRAVARDDVDAANDVATIRARVVGVGDSEVRRYGALGFSGRATGGSGTRKQRPLRLERVDVAVMRKRGDGCAWLRSARGGFKAGRPRTGSGCGGRRWIRASGTARWRLRLGERLPPGRYVAFSRATIAARYAEARFSAGDRNRVEFRVG